MLSQIPFSVVAMLIVASLGAACNSRTEETCGEAYHLADDFITAATHQMIIDHVFGIDRGEKHQLLVFFAGSVVVTNLENCCKIHRGSYCSQADFDNLFSVKHHMLKIAEKYKELSRN